MQYCGKCRRVCGEGIEKCPGCRSRKLRPAGEGDEVFLCCADMYAAGRINGALIEAGIESRLESAGSAYFNFDSSSSPTDQNIYVPYADIDKAGEIAAAISKEVELERSPEEDGEGNRPGAKRIACEVLSVAAFLALIMLAVYGADSFAAWLKGMLGMG